MEKEPKLNQELELEYEFDGNSVLVSNKGRTEANMNSILEQLKQQFHGKLQVATLYDKGCQIMFKKDCVPSEQEIKDVMSALNHVSIKY